MKLEWTADCWQCVLRVEIHHYDHSTTLRDLHHKPADWSSDNCSVPVSWSARCLLKSGASGDTWKEHGLIVCEQLHKHNYNYICLNSITITIVIDPCLMYRVDQTKWDQHGSFCHTKERLQRQCWWFCWMRVRTTHQQYSSVLTAIQSLVAIGAVDSIICLLYTSDAADE